MTSARAIIEQKFKQEQEQCYERVKMLSEMRNEVSNTSKPIKLVIDGEEVSLNLRFLNSLTKGVLGDLPKLFKMTKKNTKLKYNPVALNKDTLAFFKAIEKELGGLDGRDVVDEMPLMFEHGLADQKTVDATWYAYINVAELYKDAKINENVEEESKYKKTFVAPNTVMKKHLKAALEFLIKEIIKGDYDETKINFKGNKKTLAALQDFQIFNYNRIKKKLVKTGAELSPKEKKLLVKAKNDLIKAYEKKIYEIKLDAELAENDLEEAAFLKAAQEVLKEAKVDDYTLEQIHKLEVDEKAKNLAVRAGLDYERAFVNRFKREL